MSEETDQRRFHREPNRLRSDEKLALLEVERVIALTIEGLELGRIPDVGTGTGIFAQAFRAKGFEVVGIDANDAMLKVARRFVPEAEFRQARAEAIPYGNGEFDLSFLGLLLRTPSERYSQDGNPSAIL